MVHEDGYTLGYWLAHIHRLIAVIFGEFLRVWCQERGKPYSITPPQWGVLSLLGEEDGVPIGVIGQRRAIDAPTTTDTIGRLERNGLVARVHDAADRRVVRVFLTEEGRAVMADLPPAVAAFYAQLTHDIAPEEMRVTMSVFARLRDTLIGMAPERDFSNAVLPPWSELD